MGWQDAPLVGASAATPRWASAPVVQRAAPEPKNYDAWPADKPPPDGFHVVHTNGAPYIVKDFGMDDATRALGDLPGVGMAERFGQGAVRLAGKAASGIAGMFGGGDPDAVHDVQNTINDATELPPSNDPLVQGVGAVGDVANKVGGYVDRGVGNLPPGWRTGIEAAEEALPDVASVLGFRAPAAATGARVAAESGEAPVASAVEAARGRTPVEEPPIASSDVNGALREAGYQQLPRQNPNSTLPQRVGASIAGEGPLAQQQTLTDQAATDELARNEAEVPQGKEINYKTLKEARDNGPAQGYNTAHSLLPQVMDAGDGSEAGAKLQSDIKAIGDTTSQLPRSPDVEGLKQYMLGQPQITRDQIFSNIQQARDRASSYYRAEQPDSEALGDAYSGLANAYEDYVGTQLPKDGPYTLQDWQNDRTRFAKNYTVQSALKGTSVDASKIASLQTKNPGLLTGGLQLIAEQHNRFPLSTGFGPRTFAPDGIGASGTVPGIVARHITGPAIGAGTGLLMGGGTTGAAVGGAAGLLSSEAFQGFLRRWLGGNPAEARQAAAGAATNPRLGYHFGNDEPMEPGWNRSPPSIAGLLPSPEMVNAGGGATTSNTLRDLGLSPDVQAAGAAHPGAPRSVPAGTEPQEPPRGGAPTDFQGPQNWTGLSLQPETGAAGAARGNRGDAALADLLAEGVPPRAAEGVSAGPMGAPPQEGLTFTGSPDAVGAKVRQGGAPKVGETTDDYGNRVALSKSNDPGAVWEEEQASGRMPLGERFAQPEEAPQRGAPTRPQEPGVQYQGRLENPPLVGREGGPSFGRNFAPEDREPQVGPGVPSGDIQRAETSRAGEAAQGGRPGLEDANVSRYGIRGNPEFPYEGPRPTGKPRWTGKGPEPEEPEPFDPNTPPKRPSGGGGAGQMNREAILGDLMESWFNDRRNISDETPTVRTNNGSSPGASGAGSLESINRGSKNLIETNGDNAKPVARGVDQVDLAPKKGHVFVNADTGKLVDSGGMSPRQAQAVLNRFKARKTLADELEPSP